METPVTETEVKSMSIFGDLDVSEISDDPFGVANNTYWAVCTDAKFKEKDGNTAFVITWQIDDPGGEYDRSKITEYYSMYPGLTWAELDGEQKKRMKFLKLRLRRGFDLSEKEINTIAPAALINKGAYITTKQNPASDGAIDSTTGKPRMFTNITDALSRRLFEEEGGTVGQQNSNELAKSIGL